MISKNQDQKGFPVPNLCEGTGTAELEMLFARGALPRGVVRVTLEPGASCGEHVHTEDGELFYVLEGELTILEDGRETVLRAGECEYCSGGHSHGAVNRSQATARYLAVMLL